MGNENSSPENQDVPPVPEPVQLPSIEKEVKKKKQRKKNRNRSVEQDELDTSPLDSAVPLPLPDNGSSLTAGDTSLKNDGLCSNAAEESSSASPVVASPDVMALGNLLHEPEDRATSEFLEGAEETPVPMPMVECAKEYVAVGLPALLPHPTPVNDKDTRTIPAVSLGSGSDVEQQPAATLATKDEQDLDNSGSQPSPSSAATWMLGAGFEQTNSTILQPLQQSQQLNDEREAHAIPLPKSEQGGDNCITQETSQETEFLEVGYEEQAVIKPGGQNTDGIDSLWMKEEALIPNYPTTGGSDFEIYGAVVDGQSFVKSSDSVTECSNDVTTSKGDECHHVFPEYREQSGPVPALPNMTLKLSNLALITMSETKNRGSPSEKECPNQVTNTQAESLFVTERENHNVDLLVSSEHSRVSFLPNENEKQNPKTASESRAEQITQDEHASGGKITVADPENLVCFVKEDSVVDKGLSLGENARDFTSESELTELIKKENIPEENKDISLGEGGSQERPVLTSPIIRNEVNCSQGTLLTFDINKRQESPDTNWDDYCSSLVNTSESVASGKALEKEASSECSLNVSKDHSPELSLGSDKEKAATDEKKDINSLSVEALHLQGGKCSQSCDLLNPTAEDAPLNFPACKMAEKVCSADAHGSLLQHSEDNTVMQSERDGSGEHRFAQKTEWELEGQARHEITSKGNKAFAEIILVPKTELEHQDFKELASIAECVLVEKAKLQEDMSPSESKKHSQIDRSDADSVLVTVTEQSNAVGKKESNETRWEEYKTEMKSQATDTTLAQKPESKLDSPQHVQQGQVTEENDLSMKEAYSSSIREQHNYMLQSNDGEAPLETLHRKTVDVQPMVDVLIPPPQVEPKDSPKPLSSDDSNQQHISSTEVKDLDDDNLRMVTNLEEQEPNERSPERKHSLELNQASGHQGLCESEMKVTVDVLHKPREVLCGLEMKPNNPIAVADENAPLLSISDSVGDTAQDGNLQTLIYPEAEESCLNKETLSKPKQEVSNFLISDSVHEVASLSDVLAKESAINKQLGGSHGLTDSTEQSNTGVIECIPLMQETITAHAEQPQTLLGDFEVTCADDDSKSNRTDPNFLSKVTELGEESSDIEIKEKPCLVDKIVLKDELGKISDESAFIFMAAENVETQEYPPVSSECREMSVSGPLDKTGSNRQTEFLAADSQTELTALSTSTLSGDQLSKVDQQPKNSRNDGSVDELQKEELGVMACQNVLSSTSNLQIAAAAATPIHEDDTLAEKSATGQRKPNVLHLDNIPSETDPGNDSVIPIQGFLSEESITVQDSPETGQFEGNLSPFNFMKLQTEISAIKTKGAKSDVNFKAQQFDSSVESLFSLSSLEEKLLSLSSFSKQAGCNEGIATNITCVDDRHSKSAENTGSVEKSKSVFVENFSIPTMETDTPKQYAGITEKEPDLPSSRGFGIGFFDFRKHISKIFEKTNPTTLTAEYPHFSAENSAGEADSPVAKEIPECKRELEQNDESNTNGKPKNDQKTEGCISPLEARSFDGATDERIAQEEKLLMNTQDDCLPGAFSENIVNAYCLSEDLLSSLPELDNKVDSLCSSNVKAEESECVSAISSDHDENHVCLETGKLQPANSSTPEIGNLPPPSDNELSLKIAASQEVVLKSDFDRTTAAEAEEGNLISLCNAEPGLSEEERMHYGNLCRDPMPSEDKGNGRSVVDLGNMSALPSLEDGLCVHRTLPGENQNKSICCDRLDENALQDKVFMTQDALRSTKCLQTLVDAQEQEKELHGLIDYFKNEANPDDFSPGYCKPEPSTGSEGCVEEANDTMLNTAEIEARISVDTPKTGTTSTLFTDDCDSALQPSICSQGTDEKKPSEPIQGMEQSVHTGAELALANQCREENLAPEKSLQDAQEKGSTISLPESEQHLASELQNMATEELPDESKFPELCHSLLAVPEKDAIAAKDTSDEARDDVRAESSSAPGDVIKLVPDVDLSKEPKTIVLSDGHDTALVSAELIATSISQPGDCQRTESTITSVPDPRSLTLEPATEIEQSAQECSRLHGESKRSSDSEEAFETPESTTPVKAAPPLPPPLPEVATFDIEEQEVRPQLPSEDTGFCSETVSITDVSHSESVEESPFHPPSHSFSTVFDEDKPIASSGTYNLDFDNIEIVDSVEATDPGSLDAIGRDSKSHVRRKSTDSVPISRSTLSRSLSLQAGDFDGASFLGNSETAGSSTDTFGTGSSSASSTLKRTKKPRPASLKKKQLTKKSLEVPPVKEPEPSDIKQDSATSGEEKVSEERLEPIEPECTEPSQSATEKQEPPVSPAVAATYPFDPSNSEEISASGTGDSRVQNSPPVGKKVLPLTTAPEAVEVTPSDTGGQEDPPVKGLAVRLEFDYSEEKGSGEEQQESPPLPKKVGKKPGAKMPLRRPKTKKTGEKLDNAPATPTKASVDPNEIPVPKGSYTFEIDKWDDPNFNPFSSTCKMQDSPKLPPQTATYSFDPDVREDTIDPFKPSSKVASSPTKSPASFEIPANASEINGTEGDSLNKPAKKKKTPLKTDTFRVKKSPKRSPLSDPPSQETTPLPTAETPSVVSTVVHATDEEKLASSVGNQKWTCMTVALDSDKQDYPQPSDLSTFVNETKFISPTEELEYGNSYEIEYMEKIGSSIPQDDGAQTKQSLYLMFDAQQESPVKSPPVRLSDSTTPCSGSSLEETETQLPSGMKLQHPASRSLAASQESSLPSPDKSKAKELEPMTLGTTSNNIDITTPEDPFVSADALLNRISHPPSVCDQLQYLEPDLAEKNPPIFAQKLQEELEFAAMRIEALKLARQITLSSFSSLDTERDPAVSADVSISKSALYSRIGSSEGENTSGLLYQQQDLDSALRVAREEIIAKEREISEWKEKYEESRREVLEMRKIVSEYEKTIAQMIEDEQREKSMSHHTVQQLIIEKEQALADLNSVEKSLADLFRRYEKMKEVLEGFRKNEEVLKKCAQEYLSRVKKEEQRYQALKIHAEEKLDRANAEIAQVRGKSQQEQAAYQASLRKEQLKVDALERTLEQKNKEIEELTKICDELIAKMGKS
ncbi:transforming acidic coiled-coil-containing protein 2 isoform X3 [Elgaria multicarinata webbii]|uniref:transforming acidic coiled-coil-containing protein 2 isoform X3 n=1 Tax=Elgaria multicarinata webbii TaxID=159646 RepID=UPI002FCD0B4B